jgi:hypothetical protein
VRQADSVASNILASPQPAPSSIPVVGRSVAADAPAAITTVVRVCQGKKCAAAGGAAVLAQYAAMPNVIAQPAKCLKQCRRCIAVEMATGASAPALHTDVRPSTAAQVLAQHQRGAVRSPAASGRL